MFVLYLKEIRSFLSSLIGYVVILVFLLFTSLFMWVFSSGYNILENGFSSLEPLFGIAPWVFLFLIPAVTMRSFADEKKAGTMELLFTKPLTDFQIVFAKFLAGLTLVLIALLPTLVYYYSVNKLGSPIGNIDVGGTWGSYIGLFFLAAAYVAIGIFASALSDNQIVSFIIAITLCAFVCYGFDLIASAGWLKSLETPLLNLGINTHYDSMSRGVIDSRDVLYFFSLIALFLMATKTILESRKW